MNKIINVTLTSGIIGLFSVSPMNTLRNRIEKENANGWKVLQVMRADSGNLFLAFSRIIILLVTLFFYCPANGYYIILEKATLNLSPEASQQNNTANVCLKCSSAVKEEDAFCENCGNKLK
jgi:uncharacterized paraquat-inducible protein A